MNEFTWTMSKLRLIIENSLDGDDDGQVKTCFKTFCLKVENEDGEFCYQGIKLAKYANAISSICTKDGQRFSLFVKFVAFSNILLLLDTKSWPKDDFVSFSNCEINKLTEHYIALLKKKKNGHDATKISSKWTHLKTYIFPMLHNSPNESYLEIWHQIFRNNEVMAECQNIMHIFEILIIVSFKNAIVEHLFSRMNWVKTNFRNRLSRSRLDMCLRVGEEGPSIKDFELDRVINRWWTVKEWCLKSRPHDDPTKKASSFEFC